MKNVFEQSKAGLRALSQRACVGLTMVFLSVGFVGCGGGGGGAAPHFALDANGVLTDSTTGIRWAQVAAGSAPTSAQRWPTVDELLYLIDKSSLADLPAQFSATLLNNDLVFAGDVNNSRANALWGVSFASYNLGAVYNVDATDLPTVATPQPKQLVVVTSGSPSAFYRTQSTTNYFPSSTNVKKTLVTYDKENDLTWKTCSEGMTVSDNLLSCLGTPSQYTASNLDAQTFTDGWRLPTRYELAALLDRDKGQLANPRSYMINGDFFDILNGQIGWWSAGVESFPPRIYWSSTTDANAKKFVISFDEGSIRPDTGGSYYIRLVRSGKY
ncbi:hypothetical protein C5F52_24030 [Limnohabitans sp. TS-CS-82]|nr:hypothetical protein C5F52_24030 [Limnohabitans sp. TS-CS-82]